LHCYQHWSEITVHTFKYESRERERERAGEDSKGVGGVGRGAKIYRGERKIFVLPNAPRHCPLVLLVKSCFREGKALGSVFCYEQIGVVE
jgi:hypothetical protein